MDNEKISLPSPKHLTATYAWEKESVKRLNGLASWGAYLLLLQSLVLLLFQNDVELKLNLLMQIAALTLFALLSKGTAGTYLNAPLVFASSIFIWHSAFLLGYYFELAPIFRFAGNAFNVGFEYVYKATALVGLSIAFAVIGMIWGYRRQRMEARMNTSRASMTHARYSSLGPAGKRVAWYLMGAMAFILALFLVREGTKLFSLTYIDLYAMDEFSLSFLLFFRSQFFWVFVIVLVIACFKDNPRLRNLLALFFLVVCVLMSMLGARTVPFMYLTALLLSWDSFVTRIRLWMLGGFVLFLALASFVIASGREKGLGTNVFNLTSTGRESIELLDLFYEQGKSIQTVLRTMEFTQQTGPVYGRTLVDSALSVIPLPLLKPLGYSPKTSLGQRIVDESPDIELFHGVGSSLIAELYYNFGMLGCVCFFPIGWYLSRKYFKFALEGDVFAGVNVMVVASMYTAAMRDDLASYLRLLIYGFLIISVLRRKREDTFFGCHTALNRELPVSPPSRASFDPSAI